MDRQKIAMAIIESVSIQLVSSQNGMAFVLVLTRK